jgi:5-hydroxyisourate hydrolase-like protein (transthyretin family)
MAIAEVRSVLFAVRVVSPLPEPAPEIANLLCVDNDANNGVDPIPEDNCGSVITPFALAQVGNYVWEDLNRNGIQEAGEPPVANVEVRLFATQVQPDAARMSLLMTTTTDALGNYYFTNLEPGQYQLQFVLSTGYAFTLQRQGGDPALDSDASEIDGLTDLIALADGTVDNTWDAGLFRSAVLGDRAWIDANGNGLQDADEIGLEGVVITLNAATAQPTAVGAALPLTRTTGADGLYLFDGLVPGEYYLNFAPPPLWQVTLLNVGVDGTIDSDVDPATLHTAPVTLQSNEVNRTIDGGFFRLGALGRYVWFDANSDGIRQDEELPATGVTVRLFREDGAAGALLDTQTTDAAGHFAFNALVPGIYVIEVTPLPGYQFTLQNVAAPPDRNSDVDVVTGRTAQITLREGQEDLTWGAGLVVPTADLESPEPLPTDERIFLPAVVKQ